MEEINGFFMDGIPAMQWRDQPRLSEGRNSGGEGEKEGFESSKVVESV